MIHTCFSSINTCLPVAPNLLDNCLICLHDNSNSIVTSNSYLFSIHLF